MKKTTVWHKNAKRWLFFAFYAVSPSAKIMPRARINAMLLKQANDCFNFFKAHIIVKIGIANNFSDLFEQTVRKRFCIFT